MTAFGRFLATWGCGDFGRLGHGVECLSELAPRIVQSLRDGSIRDVACGGAHTVALSEDGSVYTSGLNVHGQLGHSHDEDSSVEFREMLLPEAITSIAAGAQHTLMLAESGDVWAVGQNNCGQLGLGEGSPSFSNSPRRIPALAGAKLVHIAAGMNHSLAVTASGQLLTWGSGTAGVLGHGSSAIPKDRNEVVPRLVASLRGRSIVRAAAGFHNSGCTDSDGGVWMWGDNTSMQVGNPGVIHSTSDPELIKLRSCDQLAMSGHHSMALRRTSELFTWGTNENGVLGLGSKGPSTTREPMQIPNASFSQIACGWKHSAGVTSHGRIFTWGWGGSEGSAVGLFASSQSAGGQLGLGNEFDYWQPSHVQDLRCGDMFEARGTEGSSWKALQISCGFNHTAAVLERSKDSPLIEFL